MYCCCPLPAKKAFHRNSQIIEPMLVEVVEIAVRPGGVYQGGNRIDDPQRVFRFGLVSWYSHGEHHTSNPHCSADRISSNDGANIDLSRVRDSSLATAFEYRLYSCFVLNYEVR